MRLRRPHSILGWAMLCLGGLLALALLLLLVLVAAPVDLLRPAAERALSDRFARHVTIDRLVRENRLSLVPTVRLEGVTIPQPSWIAQGGPPMARIRAVSARLPLLPVLVGRIRPRSITVERLDLLLIREASGRANWQGGRRAGKSTGYARLTIRDSRVRLIDRKRDRSADVSLAASPEGGFRVQGAVRLRGTPGRIRAAARVDGRFSARIESAALTAAATGRMGPAYESARFSAKVEAQGRDLRDLDAVIDAGLPGTQPFQLSAQVTHDKPDWIIRDLRGTIGRSRIAGTLTVGSRGERTLLDGDIRAAALDLDDLATDAALARAAAGERAIGPRLVPPTRIDLTHLRRLDGRLAVRADRLLWRTPTPFLAGSATLRLDRGTLRVDELKVRLPAGMLTGHARIVHPDGEPRLTLDLRVADARLEQLFGTGAASAALVARVRIAGTGRTVRGAVAQGAGSIALVGRNGSLDLRSAELLGGNVGRALRSQPGERTPLRCLVARFEGRGGRFVPRPLVLDTAVMRADGRGLLDLSTERLSFVLDGRSKVPAAFRLSGPIRVEGTIKRPIAAAAAEATSTRGILKSVGRALAGRTEPAAVDADCAGLAKAALR